MEIFVINLDKRKDRWELIKNKFIGLNLIRISAIENITNGVIGCFESHQKCIKLAKDKKLNKILVFEDDCDIINLNLNEFIDLLKKIENYLNIIKDWNVFYGAGNKLRYENIIEKKHTINISNTEYNIFEVNFLKTAHFVWYNSNIYDWFLEQNAYDNIPIDKIWHNKFNCLVIIPFITTQTSSYSDIEKKNCNYTISLKRYERKLIKNLEKNT